MSKNWIPVITNINGNASDGNIVVSQQCKQKHGGQNEGLEFRVQQTDSWREETASCSAGPTANNPVASPTQAEEFMEVHGRRDTFIQSNLHYIKAFIVQY